MVSIPGSLSPDYVFSELCESGVYATEDEGLRACVNASPRRGDNVPRLPTQVDLVLPPAEAFSKPGLFICASASSYAHVMPLSGL